ncbi:MAG TPA: hypothetical protein VLC09_04835 [Polyangiaceae bacterium]|nr:hypothetical protein [Polyangiaceae bacterium]
MSDIGEVRVVEIDAHHAKGIAGNMLFCVWRFETQATAYVRARTLLSELGAQHPSGVGLLQVIETTALPPDTSARAEFPKLHDVADRVVKHSSIVHEGTGFKAAAVRTITSGVYLVSRRKFPQETFSSLDQAAAWHATNQQALGWSRNAAPIAQAVRTLRRRLEEIPPP